LAVRLEWEGKPARVERVALPFQTVETINVSRATRERDAGALFGSSGEREAARNLLVWGDNKLVMSSLLGDYAGAIKLVYIDPPFDTGADFSLRVDVGGTDVTKEPSVLEEHAYRDTWGAGYDSYLSMMYPRLILIHELLSEDGSLYLHCAPTVSHTLRVLCDEIFGPENFRNEIAWKRTSAHSSANRYGPVHDSILYYSKGSAPIWNGPREDYEQAYLDKYYKYDDGDGRLYWRNSLTAAGTRRGSSGLPWRDIDVAATGQHWKFRRERLDELDAQGLIYWPPRGGFPQIKRYRDELKGKAVSDVWMDLDRINPVGHERLGYPTQKPEALLTRIIEASSNDGDLVADFFVGSGTTVSVAEQLGRRWVGCDLGRFAIHTTRKRLLNLSDCRPFDIKNLGAYERQRWQIDTGNGALRAYLDTILAFYLAEPVEGFAHLHGRKANRMVHVGATDAPVTIDETEDVMDEMADNGIEACDLLGWEWEMGLHDTITERARRRGLDLRPRQIPREVMERKVTETDAVRFFELAHVDLDVRRQQHEACVVLKDFAIPSEDLIPRQIRENIKSWSDLIDYWSVDFDFSDEVFYNQWQAYRTRDERELAVQSDWHEYPAPGRYAIVVKIIDIFGNDTTKLAEVRIK